MGEALQMKVLVLTVSDRASKGVYEDLSGPAIEKILLEHFPDISIRRMIVPDEPKEIRKVLESALSEDYIITTGGTGLSPRDITPEVTTDFCEKMLPGIAEILRMESYRQTPNAMLSRGVAGIRNKTIIINLPGSVKAVQFCMGILIKILPHALEMLEGKPH
jgi:molybdopterin adenylyltransferase